MTRGMQVSAKVSLGIEHALRRAVLHLRYHNDAVSGEWFKERCKRSKILQ